MNDHGADDMIAMGSWVSLANKEWRWLYAIGCLAKPLFPTIGCRPTFPPQQSYSLTHFSLEKHLSAVTLWFQNTKSFFFLAFNNVTIGFLKRILGIFVWKVNKVLFFTLNMHWNIFVLRFVVLYNACCEFRMEQAFPILWQVGLSAVPSCVGVHQHRSSLIVESTSARTLTLQIPAFEYQPWILDPT